MVGLEQDCQPTAPPTRCCEGVYGHRPGECKWRLRQNHGGRRLGRHGRLPQPHPRAALIGIDGFYPTACSAVREIRVDYWPPSPAGLDW